MGISVLLYNFILWLTLRHYEGFHMRDPSRDPSTLDPKPQLVWLVWILYCIVPRNSSLIHAWVYMKKCHEYRSCGAICNRFENINKTRKHRLLLRVCSVVRWTFLFSLIFLADRKPTRCTPPPTLLECVDKQVYFGMEQWQLIAREV